MPFDSDLLKRFVVQMSTSYANMYDRIIAPSRSIADLIVSRGVERPVEAIPTGVDFDFFRKGDSRSFREKAGIPESAFVIGHLGRLAPEKNLIFLSRAAAECLAADENTCFLIVGDGPGAKGMKQIFAEQNLSERVFFAGKKSGDELRNAYQSMNLFLFSSKSETQGMVLAEAMASGLPVVALDASGVREVVADEKNGRLLPEDTSAPNFAKAALDLISSPETMKKYAHKALSTAEQFTRKICAAQVADLYKKHPMIFT